MTYRPRPVHPKLGDELFDVVEPARFPKRVQRFRNQRWAERVGLGELDDTQWEAHFARFEPLPENLGKPLALRYHGHQFDSYNPRLGDGRGFLFAQLLDDRDRVLDLGTKGSGQTPWSRGGDGRLTLKGGVREILATEMLEALGVNTSKTFSLHETGESLFRGDEPSPTRSSVLVRLSHSHVRIGTFQRLAWNEDRASISRLVEHCHAHYQTGENPLALMEHVVSVSARLVASWMMAGFVHGVLNSDNMVVTGESFDYGPWRFLPKYDTQFTAAYFDESGLYAFGRQPRAVLNNMVRLAAALSLVEDEPKLIERVRSFEDAFDREMSVALLRRLGLGSRGHDDDMQLVEATFDFLGRAPTVGYEQFFFETFGGGRPRFLDEAYVRILERFDPIAPRVGPHFDREAPCTMLIEEVESIWKAISERDDWAPLHAKVSEIRSMGAALSP
ncbi:MAG: protein adenylyltransferase SelO family protein [Polyangiales bacterium]